MIIIPEGSHESSGLSWFDRLAKGAEIMMGHPLAFSIAILSLFIWAGSGPWFHYSDTWQLVINTATTIVTFLMVFLIQNSQNRASVAIQLKLDELLRCHQDAHNALVNAEELTLEELERLHKHYETLATKARERVQLGKTDIGVPHLHLT